MLAAVLLGVLRNVRPMCITVYLAWKVRYARAVELLTGSSMCQDAQEIHWRGLMSKTLEIALFLSDNQTNRPPLSVTRVYRFS